VRAEIRSHTGLRGIAAICVVGYHQQFTGAYKFPWEAIFRRSYLMVDLFFILSGFVLSYVYCEKLDVRSFYRARFARIYPLHVFALLSFTALVLGVNALNVVTGHVAENVGSVTDWVGQLLLLNAWVPEKFEWNKPSWSISAEAFAYLLFPAVMAAMALRPRLTSIALLIGAATFYALVGTSLDITVGLAPLRCLAGFGLGMALFRYRETPVVALSGVHAAAVVWIVAALLLPVSDVLVIPGFAALVFTTGKDGGVIARLLACRPLHRLGELSYSVYLMHFFAGGLVGQVWTHGVQKMNLHVILGRSLFLTSVFVAVVAVSATTYRYIERPFQDLLRGRSRRVAMTASAP